MLTLAVAFTNIQRGVVLIEGTQNKGLIQRYIQNERSFALTVDVDHEFAELSQNVQNFETTFQNYIGMLYVGAGVSVLLGSSNGALLVVLLYLERLAVVGLTYAQATSVDLPQLALTLSALVFQIGALLLLAANSCCTRRRGGNCGKGTCPKSSGCQCGPSCQCGPTTGTCSSGCGCASSDSCGDAACKCGCQEGKPCTCRCTIAKCKCGCRKGKKCTCKCGKSGCKCGCNQGKTCTCGGPGKCGDSGCGCGCTEGKPCLCVSQKEAGGCCGGK